MHFDERNLNYFSLIPTPTRVKVREGLSSASTLRESLRRDGLVLVSGQREFCELKGIILNPGKMEGR